MQRQAQSSFELLDWRKECSILPTARSFSKNQNAIDQPSSISPSSSINFTTDHPVELHINANNTIESISNASDPSVTITRRSSKPSRHESVQKSTSQTRKHQRDRYLHYHHRLQENQLYSLNVSSNSIECYDTNCEPSVYNASYRCRTITSENNIDTMIEFPILDGQELKENISYVSLTNLSDLIDHEPNVSRRNSYARSRSSILLHKPSLFLADVFNRMTHEQRAKSIAQLVQFHENRIQSSSSIDKLQKAASLPNLKDKLSKLHSVISLLSEKTAANNIQMDNQISSSSLIEQKSVDKDMSAERFHQNTSDDKLVTLSNENIIASPNKLVSFPEHKGSDDKIHSTTPSISIPAASPPRMRSPIIKPSPILIKSNKSNTSTDSGNKTKISRSNQFLEADPNEHSLRAKLKSSKIERVNTQPSNLLDSITNSPSTLKPRLDDEAKSKTNLENNESSISKSSVKQNIPSSDFQSSNNITDHPSQHQRQHKVLSQSDPNLIPSSPIDDGDPSTITRSTTASTNLTHTNDDDNQSTLIDEQLKRSSLGLTRDSLELLRNTTPRHASNDEQITPHTNMDSTPHQRKSVLKSHSDSLEKVSAPDLISYVAIDEVKGDKQLLEEQLQRRSLTIGGGTVISCISPKPKRDSLTLIQERYSGSTTPRSGYYHLLNSESKHVEFIRKPGDAITPVFHIGREMKKHSSNKPFSPLSSNDRLQQQCHFPNHTSDTSVNDSQKRLEGEIHPRRPSLDSLSRRRTPQTLLTSTSIIHPDDIGQESNYSSIISYKSKEIELSRSLFTQNDYDEMLRLMMTPISKTNREQPIRSKIELFVNHRLTTFQNLILVILLISFYVFIFIKVNTGMNRVNRKRGKYTTPWSIVATS